MTRAALVTGSGRGIGLEAAKALAREGFSVALNDREDNDELERAVQAVAEAGDARVEGARARDNQTTRAEGDRTIRAEHARAAGGASTGAGTGVKAFKSVFDVADLSAHESALREIEEAIGPLTTLVNNAGVSVLSRGDPLEASEESWDRCMSVNAKATFFLTQAFARRLLARKRDGNAFRSIVNVTSSNAVAVAEPRAEYAASKAAAAMASKAWAVRLGRENIAVYDVQPGLIDTQMTASVIARYEERAKEGLTLIPRVGKPEEIGEIIAVLASGKLPYTTGQVISADGGLLVPRF